MTHRENLIENATEFWENEKVYSCILKNDVYYIYHKDSTIAELPDLKELIGRYIYLYKRYGPMKVIAEMGPYSSMDKTAREYLQSQKEDAICEAVVISGLGQRLIINFYFRIAKHHYPSLAFKNFNKALEWVDTF